MLYFDLFLMVQKHDSISLDNLDGLVAIKRQTIILTGDNFLKEIKKSKL